MNKVSICTGNVFVCLMVFFLTTIISFPVWAGNNVTIFNGEIPVFPGGAIVNEKLFQGLGICDFEVVADPEKVLQFYREAMQLKGWPSGSALADKNKGALVIQQLSNRFAVNAQLQDGITRVRVMLVKKEPPAQGESGTVASALVTISQTKSDTAKNRGKKVEALLDKNRLVSADFPISGPVAIDRQEMFFCNVRDDNSLDINQSLTISFTQPLNPVFFSFEMSPDTIAWDVQWSKDFKKVTLIPNPLPASGQTFQLTTHITGGPSIEKTITFTSLLPSRQLDHGVKNGLIDLNQASRYRILSLFEPNRVPEKYRILNFGKSATPLMKKVRNDFDLLGRETRQELLPYFLSPANPKSYWHQKLYQKRSAANRESPFNFVAEAWAATPQTLVEEVYITENGYELIVIGMNSEADTVRRACKLLEKERMYEEFKDLLDVNVPTPTNKIYFYILPKWVDVSDDESKQGQDNQKEDEKPAFGQFFQSDDTEEPIICISAYRCKEENILGGTLAHELFHAFQVAFEKKRPWSEEDVWLEESTAVWAEDFINKEWNSEQQHIKEAFEEGFSRTYNPQPGYDHGEYGFYIFPYFLTNVEPANEGLIYEIWHNRGKGDTAIDALTNALGNNLNTIWKGYSLSTLDVEPKMKTMPDVVGKFDGIDPLEFADKHGWEDLIITPKSGDQAMVELAGLQIAYFDVMNVTSGPGAPAVRFDLTPFAKNSEKLSVQAVIHYVDGRHEYEDWSGRDERLFCLNRETENFVDVKIAIGCSDKTGCSDSGGVLTEPLAVVHDLSSRCHYGSVTLTRQFEERERLESTSYIAGTTETQSRYKEGGHSATIRLELDLENPILLQQREALDLMQQRVKDIDPELVKTIREYMETTIKNPQPKINEKTGLKEISYRVKSYSIRPVSSVYRYHKTRIRNDVLGIKEHDTVGGEELWVLEGLSEKTMERIKRGHVKAHIFYDPKNGKIKWLQVPQLDIDMVVKEQSQGKLVRRSGNGYETIPRSHHNDNKREFQITSRIGGRDKQGLPADPVWRAAKNSERTASGHARYEKPIDHIWDENTGKGSRTGIMAETFTWSINLGDSLKGN